MKLTELALLERQSKIPELPKDKWGRAFAIHMSCFPDKPFDASQINQLWTLYDQAKASLDEEERLRHEKLLKEREAKINEVVSRLTEDAKKIRCWQLKNEQKVEIDGSFKWFHIFQGQASVLHSDGSLKPMEVHCPKEGQKIDLKGALDTFLKDIAAEVVNGKPYPNLVQLDHELSRLDPMALTCGVLSSDQCLGYASRYDGGSILCFRHYAKLVPK